MAPRQFSYGKTVVRYAVKYGPLVYEAVKHGREPAQRAVQQAMARRADRRRALAHARTVVEGSVLRVFRDGAPVWVVFSKDTPVTSYPAVGVPLATLLEHADLSLRTRPPAPPSRSLPRLPALADLPRPRRLAEVPALVKRAVRRRPSPG